MATSLACLLVACCWPSNDKDVTDAIKQCMADDEHTAHSAMRTLAAQADDDETWGVIVMKVARKFGSKQWRRDDGRRTDAATQLLLLMDLMPLCDSRRAINTSEELLSFAQDEANSAQLRNALVVWNALASKFDLRVASRMLTDELLTFLMDNSNHRYTTDAEVCIHALLTLERFMKTGTDNARRIHEVGYYERLEELLQYSSDDQLRLVCEWLLTHSQSRPDGAIPKKRKRDEDAGENHQHKSVSGREKKSKSIMSKRHQHSEEQASADLGSFSLDEYHSGVDLESRMPQKEVRLNLLDRTNFIKLSADGYEVRNDSTSFGSIRANGYVSSVDREGKWYYEVTLRTGGIMQIGWATKDCIFKPEDGSGVGDDFYSYAYDGCRRQIWHGASSYPCGGDNRRWKAGDVIGCLIDVQAGVISFTLNGKLDKGYGGGTFAGVRGGLAFYPAISVGAFQQCRFNFGSEPFKFKPAAYRSVNDFVNIYNIHLEDSGSEDNAADGEESTLACKSLASSDGHGSCEDLDEDRLCKICYAQESEIKLRPCGHQEICFACSIRLVVCPVCRCPIEDREHASDSSCIADAEESDYSHVVTSVSCASPSSPSGPSQSQSQLVFV